MLALYGDLSWINHHFRPYNMRYTVNMAVSMKMVTLHSCLAEEL